MTIDFERALHDAAASAPVRDGWDEARLASVRGRIRRRRAVRAGAMSVAGAGAAAVLVVGVGPAALRGMSTVAGSESAGDEADGGTDAGGAPTAADGATADPFACGATVVVPDPAVDPADVGLRVTVPEPIDPAPVGGTFELTTRVTNEGAAQVTGWTLPWPTLVVARDGVVVGHRNGGPEPAWSVDLAPGASQEFAGANDVASCGAPGEPATGEPLPAGDYEVFVEQVIHLVEDPTASPTPVTLLGGPYPLEVRD